MPPAGLEPAHPVPETGALSPELRGRDSQNSKRCLSARTLAGGWATSIENGCSETSYTAGPVQETSDSALILDLVFLIAGSAALFVSADRLVLGAGSLASRLGVSPVVVGAIVIGFGSSLPEMLVSVAALDQPNGLDLAIGNVIGSNIANVALVLGATVLIFPFTGPSATVRREGALMLGGLVLMTLFLWDLVFHWWEGAILLTCLVAAGFVVVRWSDPDEVPDPTASNPDVSSKRLVSTTALALVFLALAARLMVLGAEGLALRFGISEGLVGLTILALGTSLPELGTVLASARRGRNDLVVGNILGSNLFNALGVAGIAGILGAGTLNTDFRVDLLVMVGIAVFAGVAAFTGDRYRRAEGATMLTAYPFAIWAAL